MKKSKLFCIFNEEEQLYYGWYEDKPNIIGSGKTQEEVERDVLDSIAIVEANLAEVDLGTLSFPYPPRTIKARLVKKEWTPKTALD